MFRRLPAILSLALLVGGGRARAQSVDVSAEASFSFRPTVPVDGAPGNLQTQAVDAAASLSIPLGPRTFLLAGLAYRGQHLDYSGAPSIDMLHRLDLPLTLIHAVDARWRLIGAFAPGLAGNFSGLDRHFHFSSAAMAAYAFSPTLVVGFGAVLDYSPGRVLPLPMVTVDWQVVDHLRLSLRAPVTKLIYSFGDRVEVGAFAALDASRWAFAQDGQPTKIVDYLSVDVGGLAALRLVGRTWLDASAGWAVYRRYEVDGQPGSYEVPGFVVRTGLEVRFAGI